MPEVLVAEDAVLRVRAALWVVRDGKVLLGEHCKDGKRYFLLPGGGVDPGESWGQAAARELQEELGVEARAGALLAVFENRSTDTGRHIMHVILRGEVFGDPAPTGEDERVVGCRFVEASELDELLILPPIVDRMRAWLQGGEPGGAECGLLPWVEI
jgi:ADP-ribose pyrophosphatase YjhB (NUDIX family)